MTPPDDDVYDDGDDDETLTVPCRSCGTDVYEDAVQCPSCGDYVTRRPGSLPGKLIIVALVLAGVVAMLWLTIAR